MERAEPSASRRLGTWTLRATQFMWQIVQKPQVVEENKTLPVLPLFTLWEGGAYSASSLSSEVGKFGRMQTEWLPLYILNRPSTLPAQLTFTKSSANLLFQYLIRVIDLFISH